MTTHGKLDDHTEKSLDSLVELGLADRTVVAGQPTYQLTQAGERAVRVCLSRHPVTVAGSQVEVVRGPDGARYVVQTIPLPEGVEK